MVAGSDALCRRSHSLVRRRVADRAFRHQRQWATFIADAVLSGNRRRTGARYGGRDRQIVDHGARIASPGDACRTRSLWPVIRPALRTERDAAAAAAREPQG